MLRGSLFPSHLESVHMAIINSRLLNSMYYICNSVLFDLDMPSNYAILSERICTALLSLMSEYYFL
jgi:hypothetical protein